MKAREDGANDAADVKKKKRARATPVEDEDVFGAAAKRVSKVTEDDGGDDAEEEEATTTTAVPAVKRQRKGGVKNPALIGRKFTGGANASMFIRQWAWKREMKTDEERFELDYEHECVDAKGGRHELRFKQSKFDAHGFASTVWDSSIVMAKYLERHREALGKTREERVRNRRRVRRGDVRPGALVRDRSSRRHGTERGQFRATERKLFEITGRCGGSHRV
jgi:hypothetical protein